MPPGLVRAGSMEKATPQVSKGAAARKGRVHVQNFSLFSGTGLLYRRGWGRKRWQ